MRAETGAEKSELESQPLLLLVSLTRALAHKIRNPLSAISNELSFLSSRFPDECAPSIARVAEISAILKDACRINTQVVTAASVDLTNLLSDYFNVNGRDAEKIFGDAALLHLAFSSVAKLFAEHGDGGEPSVELRSHTISTFELRIYGRWNRKNTAAIETTSLTALLSRHLGIDGVATPFVDAIVAAHGGRITANLSATGRASILTLSFTFPRAGAE